MHALRKVLSRIGVRLLLLNLLLVFLPIWAFLYLGVYEAQLLKTQERAMVQQGRLLAAALGGEEISAAGAQAVLRRLEQRTEARLRVVDQEGRLLADSALLGPRRGAVAVDPGASRYASAAEEAARPAETRTREARSRLLYRLGAGLYRTYGRFVQSFSPPAVPMGDDVFYHPGRPLLGTEVREALAGRYGATTRQSGGGQRSLTLYSAIPVRTDGRVVGAVLVSQSTYRILLDLYEVRLDVFRIFLVSMAAAALLSLYFAGTIAHPLRRLRDEARALLDRRGRLTGSFRGSAKPDEIGDLSRALEELTRRLSTHLAATESFAADIAHELKNPLASIRSASELLGEVDDPEDRRRFAGQVEREVARLERLLSALREISGIEARLDAEPTLTVDLAALLDEMVEAYRHHPEVTAKSLALELHLPPGSCRVSGRPERLEQVIANLLDNAVSFSPEGGTLSVTLSWQVRGRLWVRLTVEDRGPGVPEGHLTRLFDRFFTHRPGEAGARGQHTGLGLAIVKAIVEGYGGEVSVGHRGDGPGNGARFEVLLPALAGL